MDWDGLVDELERIGMVTDIHYRLGEYRRLLVSLPAGRDGHAEVLTCLGEDLLTDGQVDEARVAYLSAIEEGGRTVLNPHIGLLGVELEAGDDAQVSELLAILLTRSRADQLVVSDYEWIGETLELAGRLREAMRWFTIPLRDIQPGAVSLMPEMCLAGRWRVRRELGLPLDAYDDAYALVLGDEG